MEKQKKYSVDFNSAPNSCGIDHEKEFDTIVEVERYLDGRQNSVYSRVRIYDYTLHSFVFLKDCLEEPRINLLWPKEHSRDLRTKDRKSH